MTRTAVSVPFASIALDPTSTAPLYRQLYDALHAMILAGRLRGGVQLPSTRTLASELRIARSTVITAFDQLLAEGYLYSVGRAGTYVARTRPEDVLDAPAGQPAWHLRPRQPAQPRLSRRGAATATAMNSGGVWPVLSDGLRLSQDVPLAFDLVLPALDTFPYKEWERLLTRRWRTSGPDLLRRWSGVGYQPLREAIATYVAGTRRVACTAEQVIIVNDSWQALDLVARVLLDPGETAWIEDPGYLVPSRILASAGIHARPVPVDAGGLDVAAGIARSPAARLAVVTPTTHWPLGVTMDAGRRLALLQWARQAGAWVFENDNDSQYRFAGRPVAALQALDQEGRVIYYSDVILVLGRALSLGYLVVPPALVDACAAMYVARAHTAPIVQQAVLADFIADGHLVRHMRRMRRLYADRQQQVVTAIQRELAGRLEIRPAEAGACLVGWLPHGIDDRAVAQRAREYGVTVVPLSAYSATPLVRGAVLLGYTAVDAAEAVAGARRLAAALHSLRVTPAPGVGDRGAPSQNARGPSQNVEKDALLIARRDPAQGNLPRTGQGLVDDHLWERVAPLLPQGVSHSKGGRPRMADRRALEAMVYVLRTGIAWKALPRDFGAATTVHARFQQWKRAGVFAALYHTGCAEDDVFATIDWTRITGA